MTGQICPKITLLKFHLNWFTFTGKAPNHFPPLMNYLFHIFFNLFKSFYSTTPFVFNALSTEAHKVKDTGEIQHIEKWNGADVTLLCHSILSKNQCKTSHELTLSNVSRHDMKYIKKIGKNTVCYISTQSHLKTQQKSVVTVCCLISRSKTKA